MLFKAHEIHPADDVDWTIPDDPDNWDEEMRLRNERNDKIKKQLQKGNTVQYTSSGNSLWPHVKSGDCCLYEPVKYESDLELYDIVFCEVQPYNRFFAHKILGYWCL